MDNKTFEKLLLSVQKPGRYSGGEINSVIKDKSKIDVRFAFCFPDTYEVAMSHLGMKILYGAINAQPDMLCERDFMPWVDMKSLMEEENVPLFSMENRRALKDLMAEAAEMYDRIHGLKYSIASTLRRTYDSDMNLSLYYVQVVDYLNEMTKSLVHITRPSFEHIDNNHEGLTRTQTEDLISVNTDVDVIYQRILYMLSSGDYSDIDHVLDMRDQLFTRIAELTKLELVRIHEGTSNSKAGMLYLNILAETKTMVLQSRNLLKSQRYYMEEEGKPMRRPVARM